MFHYYSAKYIRDDGVTSNDELKDNDGRTENKDGDTTVNGEDDDGCKSKGDIVNDNTTNKDLAEENDDDKDDQGVEVHKKGPISQHRWEVWRRYSEFELLKNFFQTVYPYVSL